MRPCRQTLQPRTPGNTQQRESTTGECATVSLRTPRTAEPTFRPPRVPTPMPVNCKVQAGQLLCEHQKGVARGCTHQQRAGLGTAEQGTGCSAQRGSRVQRCSAQRCSRVQRCSGALPSHTAGQGRCAQHCGPHTRLPPSLLRNRKHHTEGQPAEDQSSGTRGRRLMTLLLLRIPQDRTSVGWAELQRSREWLPPPRTTCPQFVSENLHGGSVHPPQITIPVTSCQPQGLDLQAVPQSLIR